MTFESKLFILNVMQREKCDIELNLNYFKNCTNNFANYQIVQHYDDRLTEWNKANNELLRLLGPIKHAK